MSNTRHILMPLLCLSVCLSLFIFLSPQHTNTKTNCDFQLF